MTVPLLITFLFLVAYAVVLIRFAAAWHAGTSGGAHNIGEAPVPEMLITVVIPARNEEQNIAHCLNSLRNQTLAARCFEVIVVDDHSEDNTAEVVEQFGGNVRLLRLSEFVKPGLNSYKKKAIEIAVNSARGTLIVSTDADCIAPATWLGTIRDFYVQARPSFIAMPVRISPQKSFVAVFQSLDFMMLQGITAAAVSAKKLSMCNGANLAFEKKAFEAVGGFSGIDGIASGDDMLLMHKIYQLEPDRVAYLRKREVIVNTAPVESVRAFFRQRIRWASKSNSYDDKRILPVLVIVYILNFLLFWTFITSVLPLGGPRSFTFLPGFTSAHYWWTFLGLKIIAELAFLYPVAGFFRRRMQLFFLPVFQPFHILYTIAAGSFSRFGKYQWKGRTVK